MNIDRLTMAALLLVVPLSVFSQTAKLMRQQKFPKTVPAGNYSGITPLGDDRYAVVCDKSADGFYVLHIDIDTVKMRIRSIENEGYRESGRESRDQEGIASFPHARTLFISGEADNQVLEYTPDGSRTGRRLLMPEAFVRANHNYGLESLTYSTADRCFFTTTERPLDGDSLLRIQAFSDDLQPLGQYLYQLDAVKPKRSGTLLNGVSELCALDDGRLLVLERTLRVPRRKIGAYADCRLYVVRPDAPGMLMQKRQLCHVRTRMNLWRQNLANYEGLCVAKKLDDGRLILMMVADSQNQYRNLLRDWFRLVVVGENGH